MRSWKLVLACILFAYLFLASAISLAVQYFASVPQIPTDRQESSYAEKILVTVPGCMMVQKKGDAIGWASTSLTNGRFIFFNENSWDFGGPDDIPSYVPMQPCDEYGS